MILKARTLNTLSDIVTKSKLSRVLCSMAVLLMVEGKSLAMPNSAQNGPSIIRPKAQKQEEIVDKSKQLGQRSQLLEKRLRKLRADIEEDKQNTEEDMQRLVQMDGELVPLANTILDDPDASREERLKVISFFAGVDWKKLKLPQELRKSIGRNLLPFLKDPDPNVRDQVTSIFSQLYQDQLPENPNKQRKKPKPKKQRFRVPQPEEYGIETRPS